MEQEKLRKAFGLMKQGQTKEAVAIVQSVLKEDKNNVAAWWLMTSLLADDPERQKKSLERVLALDPKHKLALQLKAKLEGGSAPKTSTKPQQQQQAQNQGKSTEEINFDWAKLEAKSAKQKEVDADSSSKTVQMASYGMGAFILIAVAVFFVVWGLPAIQFAQQNNPEGMSLRFYQAFFQGDIAAARAMVCPAQQVEFDAIAAVVTAEVDALKAQLGEGAVVSFDFAGLTAEELTNDGTIATVRVAGQYSVSAPNVETITETVTTTEGNAEELRLENGVWCIGKIQ